MVGKTIAHYEILDEIGAGGMGVVYEAWDTRLERQAAIKALPEELAEDPERLARFEREAKLLAGLKSPHIATVYGLEQVEGRRFLAMELVEGESLAERLSKGPLPVSKALELARQIAEALEEAHTADVIHRDVKPGNIMIGKDGKAKVLDFGLAKTLRTGISEADLSLSPTLTQPMTQAGEFLGTPVYMSPEQFEGKEAGKQSDIWAFGCVLYEMLTGKRPFPGPIVGDAELEPDWKALPERTPVSARSLIRRCLQKDLHRRLHDIADARIEIEEAIRGGPDQEPPGLAHKGGSRVLSPGNVALLLIVTLGAGAGVGAWWSSRGTSDGASLTIPSAPTARSRVVPEEGAPFNIGSGYPKNFDLPALAISPDGEQLAYIANVEGITAIYHRRLEDLEARRIEGTEGAFQVFFSPGGDWIGFLKPGGIMRVSLRGGAPRIVCECGDAAWGSWPTDEEIYYGFFSQILKVAAAGGEPSVVVTLADAPGSTRFGAFSLLPDGRLLIPVSRLQLSADNASIAVWDPDTSDWAASLPVGGYQPIYTPTGHLLFARGGDIWAAPLDLTTLRMTAEPLPVVRGVHMLPHFGVAHFVVSASGSLVYLAGGDAGRGSPTWFYRDGRAEGTALPIETYGTFRLSPGGETLAATIAGGSDQIHVFDIASGQRRKVTLEGNNMEPLWMGSDTLVYSSDRGGELGLFVQPADGSRPGRNVVSHPSFLVPTSWSAKHRVLLVDDAGGDEILLVSIGKEGSGALSSFRPTSGNFTDWGAQFSPDGDWIAYSSNREGTYSIYISPYPQTGQEVKVPGPSASNSFEPMWSSEGGELFFRVNRRYFSFRFEPDASTPPTPTPLFEAAFVDTNGLSYDLHPDGRFLMLTLDEASRPQGAVLVQNWFEELKRLVPTN